MEPFPRDAPGSCVTALPAADVALALGTLLLAWLAARVTGRLADRE